MKPLDPEQIVDSTGDPAFASDEAGNIVAWNRAAEALLGYRADRVVGHPCHEVLCGLDVFGNRYCDQSCAIARMAQRREPARQFRLDVKQASGARVPVSVSVLQLPGETTERFLLVHVVLPIAASGESAPPRSSETTSPRATSAGDDLGERIRSLTPREIEVLRLLASGRSSQDLANELFISLTTVRTHIQNILKKLDVHSQLEAVALAFKKGLL